MVAPVPVPTLRPETTAALAAVRSGLRLVVARHAADDVRTKGPGDLVTGTDLAVQATIERGLGEWCPEIAFVGEETDNAVVPMHGRYWLVDPLCGTANYVAGLPLVAVNVALVEDEHVTAAVVGDGTTGALYAAERDHGAWQFSGRDAVRLNVSDVSGLISIDPHGRGPGKLRTFGRSFARRAMDSDRWDVRGFGTSLVLAYLATGRLAAVVYAQDGLPVHFAAGLLLAEEAGAIVTDHIGKPWDLRSPVLVAAATQPFHRKLLTMAQQAAAELCEDRP